MRTHCVQRGECIASIAARYGVSWQQVWDHPRNAELRERRSDPGVLRVGDVVAVPVAREAPPISPGGVKRFTARVPLVDLSLSLGADAAGLPYRLVAGARTSEGTIEGDGRLVTQVPVHTDSALLVLEPDTERQRSLGLNVGEIDPPDDLAGIKQRLRNLGYTIGELGNASTPELREALTAFQTAQGLEATGELDDDTRDRLLEAHGT